MLMLAESKTATTPGLPKANRTSCAPSTTQRVSSAAGAYAEVTGSTEAEMLRVFSREGALIFEVRPAAESDARLRSERRLGVHRAAGEC